MDALMNIKYDPVLAKQLAEILLSDELTIVWGLFLSSTPKDVEPIASIILKFFDENKKVMYLMKQAVTNEIRSTSTTATLFRLNNFASKLLSSYSKRFGLAFIKIILNDIIGDLCISHKNDPDYSFEVDPDKLIGKENLRQTNLNNLLTTTQKLIDAITGASASIPIAFRSMCVHLKHETEQKFPGEYPRTTYASVGGFIFLRYICPAIVVPQKYGLLEIAPGPNINRDLLLLSKVVQTIANGATFGSKEPYLMELNPFLEQNQEQILHFLDDLSSEENLVNSDLNGAADFRNSSEIEINNNDDAQREIVVDQNQIIALLQYLGVYWQKMKNAIPQMEDSLTTKHLEDYIQMCVILNRFGIVADSKQKSLQKEIAAIDKKVQKKKAKEEKKRIQKESKDLRKNLKLGSDLTVKKQTAWDANSVIDLIRSKSSNSKKSEESPV